jgi:hypothetical protein
MKTTTSVPAGWQPDPSGRHELRLFSPEGDPTAHVSDAGLNSYEEMPGAVIIDPPRVRRIPPITVPAGSPPRSWGNGSTDTNWRAHRKKELGGTRPDVRVNQMARLVARITLLTSVDPQRRVRRVMPAFSLIVLAAFLERN